MRITDLEARLYRIPMAVESAVASQRRVLQREFVVVTLRTDGGVTGTGFSYTFGVGGGAVRTLLESCLAPIVVGSDPVDIERIWTRCWRELSSLGSGGMIRLALAAVDIAVWDILGKHTGMPLYRLLGGSRDRIPAYASGILVDLDGEPLLDQVRGFLERGFRAVKLRVGRPDPGEDVERLRSVRRLIGPGIMLMVDAVQQWSAGEAIRRASMLKPFDLAWLEEPILAEDREGHVHLRAATGVPLALGESLFTRHQFADFMRAGAVDVVQPDLSRIGGFTELMKVAKLAESYNLPIAPHFLIELSVHALCGMPNGLFLEDLPGGSLTELGVLAEPIRVVNGEMAPPASPGHGIVFDEKALARYEVK